MLKQRNRGATVLCAFLPGAGHMCMGFMKRGISFMGLFFLTIFLASWLGIGPLMYMLPVLWFYSFFDCINIAWASPEEFSSLRDDYLFHQEGVESIFSSRWAFYGGILLIFFGVYLIFDKLVSRICPYLVEDASNALRVAESLFPQIFFGVVIILIGVRLIVGKKKELEHND
jgi:hypothetical protein